MKLTPAALTLLAITCALLGLAGCASMEVASQEPLLSAAGFVVRTPQTPKQEEIYAAVPAYKVQRITYAGKVIYAYKDESKGTAYVGDEAAYQQYQKLALQKQIAQANYQAAEMNRDLAMGWYGAYGPYSYGGVRDRAWR